MGNPFPPLMLYNSASRTKQLFTPIRNGIVGMYSCGPTVYNFPHIGNYRAYLAQDFIARIFQYNGYDVTHVMNITDVDDKTIRDSQFAHKSLAIFTGEYTVAFLQDLADLNITSITYHPKATLHVNEMIRLIEVLVSKGAAYKADDGCVYFSIAHFPRYGSLSHVDVAKLQPDASGRMRNDEYSKECVLDFALWKAWSKEDGDVYWDSPFGKGRPGWHIECSVMSMKYLGSHFDVHAGGIDLLFPHHENEIAQSEAATGEPFANYWLHNEWLLINGKKMAKSAGNFTTLRVVLQKGYDPIAYRLFCLSAHYRQSLNFTFAALDAAQQGYNNLLNDIRRLENCAPIGSTTSASKELLSDTESYEHDFRQFINDDFNTPQAVAVMFDFIKFIHSNNERFSPPDYKLCLETLLRWDDVFGLRLTDMRAGIIPQHIRDLADARESARQNKEWDTADELRKTIETQGYAVEDTRQGPRIVRI